MIARDHGCTCGSGAHPRRCTVHPDAFDRHCALLDAEMGEPDAVPFTLLQHSAEPVGGWWPEDVGEPQVREEGPLHQRVGTVVKDAVDARQMRFDTLVECSAPGGKFLARYGIDWWADTAATQKAKHVIEVSLRDIIGARILYVPLGEP